jgi:hypothetical protein
VANPQQLGRLAGRLARRWIPSARQSGQIAKQSGLFLRTVVPAAMKPVHSLWHQILGFFFLVFAALGAWRVWRHPGALSPTQLAIVIIFIVVMAGYGVSSIRKSRHISRS